MKLIEVSRSLSFEMVNPYGTKLWDKLGAKMELSENEDPMEAYKAMDELMKEAHKKSYAIDFELPIVDVRQEAYNNIEQQVAFDKEWEEIRQKLEAIVTKEEAQAYLEGTTFSMSLEAKKIINQKPTKK